MKDGARPPVQPSQEPGEWQHGQQQHASSASEYHIRETVMIAQSCAADQAHLRSHSRPGSGEVFHGSLTNWSSSCNLASFAHCRLRDYVSRCTSQNHGASAARGLDATGQRLTGESSDADLCREAEHVKLRENISVSATDNLGHRGPVHGIAPPSRRSLASISLGGKC